MPELPEVETIRRDIDPALRGRRITKFEIFDRRLICAREEKKWQERLKGQVWQELIRRGKYLLATLSNGWRIVIHLRMTGQLVLGAGEGFGRHRMRLSFEGNQTLSFYDQRRFGEMRLLAPGETQFSATPLGPDALEEWSLAGFTHLIKTKTTRIHAVLLDQRVVAGIGNIYAQEALFKAGIRPSKPAERLTRDQSARLFNAVQDVLRQALLYRGTSSRNYRDAQGQLGQAQLYHAVYQRSGKPCLRCGQNLKALRLAGRGTVYCSACQS